MWAYGRELKQVRHAVMLIGDIRHVVAMAAEDRLAEAKMKLFHPLGFMLASPVETVEEALDRFTQEIAAEKKGEGGAESLELSSRSERSALEDLRHHPPLKRPSPPPNSKTNTMASAPSSIAATHLNQAA